MKRRIPTTPSSAKPSADLAAQARRLIEGGHWREATETCKQLVKQDPTGGWESSLALCYEKRATELAGKGMFKESLILLDNAERLGSTADHLTLRWNCLVAIGRTEQVVSLFCQQESRLQAALPDLFPVLQEYVAVLLLTTPGLEQTLPAESPWQGPLTAGRQALAALAGPVADLEPLLGRISLRSPFKPLRMILKALLLVRDQPDKALQLVAVLPATSPWAALSRLVSWCAMDWEVLLRRTGELSSQEMEVVCAWRGIPLASWRRARELLTAPPARLLPILLDPAVSWPLPASQIRRLAWLALVGTPASLAQFEKRFGMLDPAEKSRLAALSREQARPHEGMATWMGYLRQLLALPTSADRDVRVAMTHRHLARIISRQDDEDPDIVIHLEKSLAFDPTHRRTYQALLAWYRDDEDEKACRQLLDRAVQQFPEDADFLHEAVRQSLKNQTFKKASRLAKRLLAIDPLHAGVRQELVGACLAQARKQVQNGRRDLAVKELAEAATWQRPDDRDGLVTINQAFLAWLAQQQAEGDQLLEQGVGEAGGGVAARLRANLEGARMRLPSQWMARLMAATQAASSREPVTREAMAALVRVARDYVHEDSLRKLMADLAVFLTKASTLAYPPEELRAICHLLAQTRMYAVLERYATLGEKKWTDHAVFVYFRLLAKYRGPRENLSQIDRRRLETVLRQAEERNDRELVAELQEWLWESDPFEESFMPRSVGSIPPEAREMILSMLITVTRAFLEEQGNRRSPAMARQFLLEFLNDPGAPTREIRQFLGDQEALIEEVLERLFSAGSGTPKPAPRPSPERRRQLSLDLDES